MIYTVFLIIHIFAGTISLLSGAIASWVVKGSAMHIRFGRIFAVAMLTTGCTAVVMSILQTNYFLLSVGFFSLFLAGSGWIWGFRVAPEIRLKRSRQIGVAGLASAAYMLYLALSGSSINIVLIVFGALLLIFSASDVFRKGIPKSHHLIHGGRMGGAYIAACTAFLVVNIPSDFPISGIWIWLGPTIIGTPLIVIALRKWSNRFPTR